MLRLNLADAKDREFLESRGVDLKALWDAQKNRAILTLAADNKKRLDQPKTSKKYRNRYVYHGDDRFDSQFELSCWLILQDLEKKKIISNLKRQVKVTFTHNNIKLMSSRPDFYFEVNYLDRVIPIYADAKSLPTSKLRPFRIAQNMFRAFYGSPMIVFLNYTDIEQKIKEHLVNFN